jgi:hypothetical protein
MSVCVCVCVRVRARVRLPPCARSREVRVGSLMGAQQAGGCSGRVLRNHVTCVLSAN